MNLMDWSFSPLIDSQNNLIETTNLYGKTQVCIYVLLLQNIYINIYAYMHTVSFIISSFPFSRNINISIA